MYWKTIYMIIMDTVIVNLKYRFSEESLTMANSVDSFCKLNYDNSLYFIDHYKVTILFISRYHILINNNKIKVNF